MNENMMEKDQGNRNCELLASGYFCHCSHHPVLHISFICSAYIAFMNFCSSPQEMLAFLTKAEVGQTVGRLFLYPRTVRAFRKTASALGCQVLAESHNIMT